MFRLFGAACRKELTVQSDKAEVLVESDGRHG